MESREEASATCARRTSVTDRTVGRAALALILPLLLSAFFLAPAAQAEFGFKSLSLRFTEADGSPALQAGSHPYAWRTAITFNTTGSPGKEIPDGMLRNMRIHLPPGLVGTPALLPRCEHLDFDRRACSASSEVGSIELETDSELINGKAFPLYNLVPEPGEAAELGARVGVHEGSAEIAVPILIAVGLSPRPPYELIASISNVTETNYIYGLHLTIHGLPGGTPFITLPPSCAPALAYFEAERWNEAGSFLAPAPEAPSLNGCNRLPFRPTVSAAPTTEAADAPSGFDFSLSAPLEGLTSATGLAEANLERAVLTLPPGMTLNPPLANGLVGCTSAQLANETLESLPGQGCPQAATVGTAEINSPLFDESVPGTIFAAAPPASPDGVRSPFALYLVLRNARRGILIKQAMRIEADPQSGRLTATIPDIPQLPFSNFDLHLRGGPRGPLTTPACGSHAISYSLTPSSGAPPLQGETRFVTDQSCHPATQFSPRLLAGAINPLAGSFTPFVFELLGGDDDANPRALSLTLPAGLSADFTAVPTCPEPLAVSGACPPASGVGQATIALGPGPEPLWIPQPGMPSSDVYLAGPYRGAPYSLLIVIPAQAGPFDLGNVVLRAPITIDPATAQASIGIDDLPQILAGVPLRYRTIRLLLDRPGFIRNPTSCEPTEITGEATAADGTLAKLASRFQVGDCAALGFAPRLALRLSGGLARNAHPQIDVDLDPRAAEANIAAATFTLPAGELLDFHRLRALCARALAPERCPGGSRLGQASLRSPLLPDPLKGPIYLRAPSRRYPDLLAELRAGQLHVLLHGRTAAAPGGRLRVSFTGLPDLPLTRASITLAGGRSGIFVNSESLCARPRRATVSLSAHNGKRHRLRPAIRLRGRC